VEEKEGRKEEDKKAVAGVETQGARFIETTPLKHTFVRRIWNIRESEKKWKHSRNKHLHGETST